jgi:hypothetical protein
MGAGVRVGDSVAGHLKPRHGYAGGEGGGSMSGPT